MELKKILKLVEQRIDSVGMYGRKDRKGEAVKLTSGRDLPRSTSRELTYQKLYDYAHGEMFNDAEYWRGRVPDDPQRMSELETLFVCDDQISPALNRFVAASLGRDFEWDAFPEGSDQTTKETVSDVQTWHYDTKLINVIQRVKYLALATGRCSMRLYIPEDYEEADDETDDNAVPPLERAQSQKKLGPALEMIEPHVVEQDEGGAVRDRHGREVAYFYLYQRESDENPNDTEEMMELHTPRWIYQYRKHGSKWENVYDSDEDELLGQVSRKPNPRYRQGQNVRRPKFLMCEYDTGAPIITQSVIDKQDGCNIAWTNLRRNDDLSGFRAIITTNVEDPDDIYDEDENGQQIKSPASGKASWSLHPDMVANLIGVKRESANPNVELMSDAFVPRETPTVAVVDPVPVEYFQQTISTFQAGVAEELSQSWVKTSTKAISGDSARESRKAFDYKVVMGSPMDVEICTWALRAVTDYAAFVINDFETYQDIRFVVTLFMDVDHGDLELFKVLIPAYEKNLTSLKSVLESNPAVRDVADEEKRIKDRQKELDAKAEQDRQDALRTQQGGDGNQTSSAGNDQASGTDDEGGGLSQPTRALEGASSARIPNPS